MKKLLALLALLTLAASISITSWQSKPANFEAQAQRATGAIFVMGRFNCSGTEIGKTPTGNGVFLTARHCVADPETDKINEQMEVTFSANEGGPFYLARPLAISSTDDLALLELYNGADIPMVPIKAQWSLRSGDSIFNVSYPLGTGKEVFHGEFIQGRFPLLPADYLSQMPTWTYSMPVNLTIAHGSSGSGVFSSKERALIGVAVGTFEEGSYNLAIPSDRVLYFLNHLQDSTVEKFKQAHPEHVAPDEWPF